MAVDENTTIVQRKKEKICVEIKHFYLKKLTAAQVKADLEENYGDSAPVLEMVYFWINQFKNAAEHALKMKRAADDYMKRIALSV